MKNSTIHVIVFLLLTTVNAVAQNFNDGIGSDQIGDFPSKWDLLQGTAKVNILDGEKVIQFGDNGTVAPLIDIDDYLGDEFLVMFDLLFDDVRKSITYQHYMVRLWPGVSSGKIKIDERNLSFRGFKIHRHGVGTNYKDSGPAKGREYSNYLSELKTKEKVWRAVKIAYKKGNLKVFMDDKMVLNIPRYEFDPQRVSIEAASQGELTRAIKNVSIRGNGVTNSKPIDTNTEEVTEPELENPNSDPETPESEKIDIQSGEPILNEYPNDTLKNEETKTPGIIDDKSRESVQTNYPGSDSENLEEASTVNNGSSLVNNDSLDAECGFEITPSQYEWLKDEQSSFNKRLNKISTIPYGQLSGFTSYEELASVLQSQHLLANTTKNTTRYSVIPMVAHIVRKSNGTGGVKMNELYNSIGRANTIYEQIGLHIHLDKIFFIDDDTKFSRYYENSSDNSGDSKDISNVLDITNSNIPNKLNVYYVPSSNTSWAKFPDNSSTKQHIIMNNDHALNESTFRHELGHWFSLLHTHTGNGSEVPSPPLCRSTGDLCCDTPPDPKLSKLVNEKCQYVGDPIKDAKGNLLYPDPSNIMSYSLKKCRSDFSEEQIKRLYNSYLGVKEDRGYTLEINGEIGEKIKDYKWTSGWDNVLTFDMQSEVYLFMLKSSTGDVHIHEFKEDGTVGERVFNRNWSEGWTTARVFGVGPRKHLVLLKENTGLVHVNKINTDGTIGDLVFNNEDNLLASGWTNAHIFHHKYLFLLNSATGDMQLRHLEASTGKLGSIVNDMEENWTKGWDVTEQVANTLILYKSETGDIHVQKMKSDGTFEDKTFDKRWTKGWNTITYLASHDNYHKNTFGNLLLLRKADGHIKQNQWINDSIGPDWFDNSKTNRMIGKGWTSVNHYAVFDGAREQNYAFFLNKNSGQARIYYLNNNL